MNILDKTGDEVYALVNCFVLFSTVAYNRPTVIY